MLGMILAVGITTKNRDSILEQFFFFQQKFPGCCAIVMHFFELTFQNGLIRLPSSVYGTSTCVLLRKNTRSVCVFLIC